VWNPPSVSAASKVYVLYTGGTFAMQPSIPGQPSSPLVPAGADRLREALAGLGRDQGIAWDLRSLTEADGSEVGPLDSSSVGPQHWLTIAQAIERVYQNYDGFVVIHGTDTMAYTASALSFLLVNLGKPVVVTGSQTPIFVERTDAYQNFLNALYVAGYKATGVPRVPEVTVCFGDHLLRGNRTRKVSVDARAGFASPNYPPLGTFGTSIRINRKRVRKAPPADRPFYVHRSLDDRVMDLTLYPGVKGSQLRPFFERDDLKGFVLRTFGSGTTPRDPELLEAVASAARQGKMLLVVTQCLEGGVDLGRYDASATLLERRIISGFDLTPEAALTKLMWMMSMEQGPEIEAQMQMSHRGEQSHEHHHLSFPGCQQVLSETYSGHPTVPIERKSLRRALLRVRDCDATELRFFLNASGVEPDTPAEDVRCLGRLRPSSGQGVVEVTDGLGKLLVPNRPLRITVTAGGQPFSLGRMDLTILVAAEG
jgi:L-asparaginase